MKIKYSKLYISQCCMMPCYILHVYILLSDWYATQMHYYYVISKMATTYNVILLANVINSAHIISRLNCIIIYFKQNLLPFFLLSSQPPSCKFCGHLRFAIIPGKHTITVQQRYACSRSVMMSQTKSYDYEIYNKCFFA